VKSDLSFGRNWGIKHLAESGENGMEFGIVALFNFSDLAAQVFVGGEHDGDANLHSAIAVEHAGEHSNSVLRESEWKITTAATTLFPVQMR
jgi:hypothetical protein